MEADVGETQERQLHEDFGELRTWIERLPPMVDRPYLSLFLMETLYLTLPLSSQRERRPERFSNRVGRFAGYLHR